MNEDVMGKWNYRVIRKRSASGDLWYEIRECHYDNDSKPDSRPHSWTGEESYPLGDSPEDLAEDLRMMLRATELPVLEIHDDEMREVE